MNSGLGHIIPSFDRNIVNAHEQKYECSCIPSSVELVLKLNGKINIDEYPEQDIWEDTFLERQHSFSDYSDKDIKGLIFSKQYSQLRGADFPIMDLFSTIDNELLNNRYVIVSIFTGFYKNMAMYHMFVIYGTFQQEYRACSSSRLGPVYYSDIKRCIMEMNGTDILTYKE